MQITVETFRTADASAAFRNEMLDLLAQRHIVTVLDFIPVEERLPEEDEEYVCLIANAHSMTTGHRIIDELYVQEGEWVYYEDSRPLGEGWFVTHYAERPGKVAEIPEEVD